MTAPLPVITCKGAGCERCGPRWYGPGQPVPPFCRGQMMERTNSLNGSTFLGCSHYPECDEARALPEHVRLRREGYLELPGF